MLARRDRVCADGAHDTGVAESGLGGDNRVGNEVIDALAKHNASVNILPIARLDAEEEEKIYRVFLLLHV